MNFLPKEISYQPVPYIALIGLDAANNASHNQIWNAFAINRAADRPQLYYKLTALDHTFPIAKAKKTYERYIPSGIIKTNWLAKHLFEVPSVAVIFEEANWESLQNNDVRTRCIEKVNHVRNSLASGRPTRIVLILLQSSATALTEDSVHKDNAAKLCVECDINPKSLFIIPTNESQLIAGYVQRIEQVLSTEAKNYYVAQAKSVKSHKDQLNKSTQIYLYIRHEFKLGFFHEIRQICNTALGHYKNAYASLIGIPASPLNIFEIKSIASLLNYKICRLCFYLSVPMDAISHFRKHIEIFQNKSTPVQIEFEHHSWLSDQFLIFAELFEMAVSTFGLTPSSSQHPGIYYFDAATHMIERRRAAATITLDRAQVTTEEANFLNAITNSATRVFIGQFAWKDDLPEADRIQLAYKAMQYSELQVEHTSLLINLYVNVLNQIRKFKKPRFTRYLMYLIAKEYNSTGHHEDALTYFNNIIPFYREEKWNDVYFEIIKLAIDSAYHSADLSSFVRFAFEQMCNPSVGEQDKANLMGCIASLLNLQWKPLELSDKPVNSLSPEKEARWMDALHALSLKESLPDISINMDSEIDFLACKIAFSSSQYFIGSKVSITVALFSSLPLELANLTLQLRFGNAYYDQFCMLSRESAVALKSNTMSKFIFEFKPLLEDIGKELRVSELTLRLEGKQSVSFHWPLAKLIGRKLPALHTGNDEKSLFTKAQQVLSTRILEHSSKLNVELVNSIGRILVNEHFPLSFKFASAEAYPISNVQLSVKLLTAGDEQLDANFTCFAIVDGQLKPMPEKLTLIEQLAPGESAESAVVLKLTDAGSKSLICNFSYDLLLESEKKVQFILVQKQLICPLECAQPFTVSSTVCNLGSTDTSAIRVAEPFRLNIEVANVSGEEGAIEVLALAPNLTTNCTIVWRESTSPKWPISLAKQSMLKESYQLTASLESSSAQPLGNFVLRWARKERWPCAIPAELMLNESAFQLPSIPVAPSLVFVELHLPEVCYSRGAFMARYRIYNRLDVDMTAEIGMGLSDCFMVSGNKLIKVCIKAKLFIEQTYIFLPLLCGQLALPQLGITVHLPGQNPVHLDHISQMMPPSVKVLPQVRV